MSPGFVGTFDLVLLLHDNAESLAALAEWPKMSLTLLCRNNNEGPW